MNRVRIATYIIFGFSAILAVYIYIQNIPPPLGRYDSFAKCIAQSGTKFYGASWCPHCAAQKAEFGDAAQYLPYVECSLNGGTAQTQVCIDQGVKNYPTWVFPDGSRLAGTTGLALLAQKTNCSLSETSTPEQAGSSSPAE